MQHGQKADLGAKVLRIRGDLFQSLARGPHQNPVHHLFVLARDLGDGWRDCEHDMEVLDRQQLLGSFIQPFGAGGGLALRTVPIPTRVVRNSFVTALVATPDVSAQRCSAANDEVTHYAPLGRRHETGGCPQVGVAVSCEDVGHFEWWPSHVELRVVEVRQQVEWRLGRAKFVSGNVQIEAGGPQARVAQHQL